MDPTTRVIYRENKTREESWPDIEKSTKPKHSFDKKAKQLLVLRHVPARGIQRFERWCLGRSKDISKISG